MTKSRSARFSALVEASIWLPSIFRSDLFHANHSAWAHRLLCCSLLAKRLGIPAFRVPTQYGMGDEENLAPGNYGQILLAK